MNRDVAAVVNHRTEASAAPAPRPVARVNAHLDAFMEHFEYTALTYDDVSLVTQYADFLPAQTDLRSRLTRNDVEHRYGRPRRTPSGPKKALTRE